MATGLAHPPSSLPPDTKDSYRAMSLQVEGPEPRATLGETHSFLTDTFCPWNQTWGRPGRCSLVIV